MRFHVLVFAVVIIVAAVASHLWQQRSMASETSALKQSIAALESARAEDSRRVEQLRREDLRARTMPAAAIVTPRESDPVTETDAAPGTGEGHMDSNTDLKSTTPGSAPVELVLSNLESTFEGEALDGQWASRAAAAIQNTASPALGDRSQIKSVECRASMCRLESIQQDLEHYRKFVFEMTHSGVSKETFFTQTGETEDGRLVLTMYFSRDAAGLPRVE